MSTPTPFVSYAQHGEDVILWRALGDRGPGSYVDVGAFHPTQDSVTRALYERGWRGVNIEAQPALLAAFQRERPEDTNLSMAVGDHDGTAKLTLPPMPGWASVLPADLTGAAPGTPEIEVPMRRLDTLLAELGIEHLDVLKIDVEGAEPEVVRGLLGGTLRPLVCVVEGVAPGVGRAAGDEAVALLVGAGYVHCLFDGLNHYLTTAPDLEAALSVPANPIDGHTTAGIALLEQERAQLHATIAALANENLALRSATPTGPRQVSAPARADQTREGTAGAVPDDLELRGAEAELHDAPGARTAAVPTSPLEPAPPVTDRAVRGARRRATFARLLRGDATSSQLHQPSPLARLVHLAVTEPAPAAAIATLYREILGREAEPEGVAEWLSHLESGESLLAVAHHLAASPEARACTPERRARVLADLASWQSLVAVDELGVAAWRPGRIYTPGRVAHEIFVEAVFEVTLHRRPERGELDFEVDKLVAGAGREWLLRAYAQRPDVLDRFLGTGGGVRSRLRRARDARTHLATVRALVATAEARQVSQFLAALSLPGWGAPDDVNLPSTTSEAR